MYRIKTSSTIVDVKSAAQAVALVKAAITLGVDVSVAHLSDVSEKDGKKSV